MFRTGCRRTILNTSKLGTSPCLQRLVYVVNEISRLIGWQRLIQQESRQKVAQCIHLDAGWIKVMRHIDFVTRESIPKALFPLLSFVFYRLSLPRSFPIASMQALQASHFSRVPLSLPAFPSPFFSFSLSLPFSSLSFPSLPLLFLFVRVLVIPLRSSEVGRLNAIRVSGEC